MFSIPFTLLCHHAADPIVSKVHLRNRVIAKDAPALYNGPLKKASFYKPMRVP